jgi:AraC-like DNA-binding protein
VEEGQVSSIIRVEIKVRWQDGLGLLKSYPETDIQDALEYAQKVADDNPEDVVVVTKVVEKVVGKFVKNTKPSPRGRPLDAGKRNHIISLARANATLSMSAIARHVGCSESLVAKVFKDRAQWYDL